MFTHYTDFAWRFRSLWKKVNNLQKLVNLYLGGSISHPNSITIEKLEEKFTSTWWHSLPMVVPYPIYPSSGIYCHVVALATLFFLWHFHWCYITFLQFHHRIIKIGLMPFLIHYLQLFYSGTLSFKSFILILCVYRNLLFL